MKHSQKFIQKRRFAMALPLLVLPFLTMIFWALGGGQGSIANAEEAPKEGLNLELPDAHFGMEEWNKLTLYQKAERDSLKLEEEIKNDPYFKLATLDDTIPDHKAEPKVNQTPRNASSRRTNSAIDPNEARVNEKLDQLYRELNKAPQAQVTETRAGQTKTIESDPQFSSDVQKLEQMMELMGKGDQNDPEMKQISGMLDKILDVQHPERVSERIRKISEQKKGQVFPVEQSQVSENVSLIGNETMVKPFDSTALVSQVFASQNGFFGLEDEQPIRDQEANAIEAVVHDTQELVAGSTVKMRLLSDVFVNGHLIPKGEFIYGTCAISGERLTVAISSIRDDNSLFPVSLSAYDLDGLEGIYIPGAITRDAAKQSSDQALQSMQFLSMDQSLSAQAATAGIAAAKGLFSKKVKLIKVVVKAGYRVLLKDGNNNA